MTLPCDLLKFDSPRIVCGAAASSHALTLWWCVYCVAHHSFYLLSFIINNIVACYVVERVNDSSYDMVILNLWCPSIAHAHRGGSPVPVVVVVVISSLVEFLTTISYSSRALFLNESKNLVLVVCPT